MMCLTCMHIKTSDSFLNFAETISVITSDGRVIVVSMYVVHYIERLKWSLMIL